MTYLSTGLSGTRSLPESVLSNPDITWSFARALYEHFRGEVSNVDAQPRTGGIQIRVTIQRM